MNLSDIRLVASDLDGTLLGPDHLVSDRTTEAIRAVTDRGVTFVVATGRGHRSAVARLRHLQGSIRWVLCSNGATVYDLDAGEVILNRPIDDDDLEEAIARLRRRFPSVGFAWETPSGIFHSGEWVTNRRATATGRPDPPVDVRELRVGEEPVLKLMVAHDRLIRYDLLDAIEEHLPDTVSAATSGATFVEVTAQSANKGDALRTLCDELGIEARDAIAFGDHSNDAPMLTWVGTGYAMANADPRILSIADATAPHHAEDGVAAILESLLDEAPTP